MNDWQILKNKLRYINANDINRTADTNKRNRKAGEPIEDVIFELGRVGIATFKLVGVVDDDHQHAKAVEAKPKIAEVKVAPKFELPTETQKTTEESVVSENGIDLADYMTEKEASLKFGKTRKWFSNSRYKKAGPPFIKVDNRILYPIFGLLEYFGEKND